mmetsp:Transcript_51423/g.122439  ORF Transcript_51423/g.122439 Transcript_51423/m.122439 type:complete len:258 (-) Transcript_51423:71-844(-)
MAIKISRSIAGGQPRSLSHSEIERESIFSTYAWPWRMHGTSASPNCSFSTKLIMSLLRRIPISAPKGKGIHDTKSNRENMPGSLGIAKIIECCFHCSRSRISRSSNSFRMLGYAPKNTCSPVSYQSPSSSFQAAIFPPRTFRDSKTVGVYPRSTSAFAADSPARPAPAMTTLPRLPSARTASTTFESAIIRTPHRAAAVGRTPAARKGCLAAALRAASKPFARKVPSGLGLSTKADVMERRSAQAARSLGIWMSLGV